MTPRVRLGLQAAASFIIQIILLFHMHVLIWQGLAWTDPNQWDSCLTAATIGWDACVSDNHLEVVCWFTAPYCYHDGKTPAFDDDPQPDHETHE
jgi:hypothetical protein